MKILFLLLISLVLSNCASFSNKDFKGEYSKIKETDLFSINGKYSFYPVKKYDQKNENSDLDLESLKKYTNSYNFITNEHLKFEQIDSISNTISDYYIELKLNNDTELNVELFKNNFSLNKQQIKGILKKDGMFYLDNKYLKCNGIPYLIGGCNNNKRRITLSKNHNLIINAAFDNTGALLFFFWAGQSHNSTYEFQRLE